MTGIMPPGGLAARTPVPGAAAELVPAVVETSDGGPAEVTDPPADAVPGTRGTPYMTPPARADSTCFVVLRRVSINSGLRAFI